MKKLKIFIPLTKVDEEKRLVYGKLAEECIDHTGQIFDYESSKPYFLEWNEEFINSTGGKSCGNMRAMHTNIAAGKFTDMVYNDEEKYIEAIGKVVDDKEWEKVLEGVYTGFSIGGKFVKQWLDPETGYIRYTGKPVEVSLVDKPCIPTATFQLLKCDGSVLNKEFKHTDDKENSVMELTLEMLQKAYSEGGMQKVLSYEDIRRSVYKAIAEKLNKPFYNGWFWIVGTYPDHVIIQGCFEKGGTEKYYKVNYSLGEGDTVNLGEIVEVQITYTPVGEVLTDLSKGEEGENLQKTEPPAGSTNTENLQKTEGETDTNLNKSENDENLQKTEEGNLEKTENAEEPADMKKVDEAENLQKAGARNSKNDAEMIQKMHDNAVALGAQCAKCDDKINKMENIEGGTDLTKLVERLDSLEKAVSSKDEKIQSLSTSNEELLKKVTALENTPDLNGSPMLKVVDKQLPGLSEPPQSNYQDIAKQAVAETDPNKKADMMSKVASEALGDAWGKPLIFQ